VLLPALGIVAEVITTFSRKKLFGYRTVLYTTIATGVLSFFVWAHHQFISGIDPRMANVFTITTVLISIPIAELCFVYIATMFGGDIRFRTPMLWALAFIAEFLIGGVTGIWLGASAPTSTSTTRTSCSRTSTTRSTRSRSSRRSRA
jgi:cytochrome c oxidase subunit 1